MSVLVFGHRNPDTDAICSAIAYADLLQKTTRPDAIAACCGTPNKRTEYVLKQSKLAAPRMVMDVRPEVEDVCQKSVVTARYGDVFYNVYQQMHAKELRAIPIIDDKQKVVGLLSLIKLMEIILNFDQDPQVTRTVSSNLQRICDVVGGEFQHSIDPLQEDELLVMVGAMSAGGFIERMQRFKADNLIVVSGDRPTIQLPAIEHGVRALVVTGGYELSSGLVELAKARKVSVIKSPFDTATTTMRIKSAQFVDSAVDASFTSLPAKMPIEDARSIVDASTQSIFPVVNDRSELVGVLSKSDLLNPPKPKLILVDHNELGQAVTGAEEADILEVLDHHRLGGGLKSTQPIRFINEPVGSTCTLVARQFRAAGLTPEPGIALCMASGIISDTLYLRSPTTTDVDREVLNWLSTLVEVELTQYANDFFAIGSALRTCCAEEVITEDCKEFVEHGQRFSISQIEEIGFDLFWDRRDDLLAALEKMARKNHLEFSALLVTDVVSNGSLLLLSHVSEVWDEINYPRLDRNLYQLDSIVSRKKQLLPLIAQLIETSLQA
ncbi:MAG: putative manganese-dependent inorganic diphosphatase [Pirellula sp.]|jgi:manganese-dependent inorganic pyrophosphatase|nr:putative manganese-dependent inorganic diphosphatase [Pirellula sp.]